MSFADFARAFFALAFTLGLVGLAAYGARRFGPEWLVRLQPPKAHRRLAIVETLLLDPAGGWCWCASIHRAPDPARRRPRL